MEDEHPAVCARSELRLDRLAACQSVDPQPHFVVLDLADDLEDAKMSAPVFTILTQKELTIDLSRPAMQWILEETGRRLTTPSIPDDSVECEVDNFRNMLKNLLERSEPKPENFDLIGE